MANYIDKNYLLQFGSNLKRIRLEKSITQAQLAIDCDFDVSMISRIERGVINTSLSNIKAMADALGVEPMVLLDFSSQQ